VLSLRCVDEATHTHTHTHTLSILFTFICEQAGSTFYAWHGGLVKSIPAYNLAPDV